MGSIDDSLGPTEPLQPPGLDAVAMYIREIERIPALTATEQAELLRRVRAGDHNAQKQLLEAHLKIVVPIAKLYANRGVPLLDLIQAGNIGLIRAANELEVSRPGPSFADIAKPYIQRQIEDRLASW